MMISTFDELIAAAHAQPNTQHLLLVYTHAQLPDDPTPEQRAQFEQGHGGVLVPAVCVDKTAEELVSFEQLCEESQAHVPDWDVVFAAAVEAPPLQSLTPEQIDQAMEMMLARVKQGQITGIAAFDRQGDAIQLA